MPFLSINKDELSSMLDGKGEWGSFFVQNIVLMVLISTVSFCISTVEELYDDYTALFTGIEYFTVIIFTIEYILRLWVADNVCRYVFQPIAIIDLLSILPSWVDLILPGDVFPAMQFLRMLRLFKFLSTSDRGAHASAAFAQSWKENKPLIVAASFAGGAVWLVTASLLYFAERNNPDMLWCYPMSKDTTTVRRMLGTEVDEEKIPRMGDDDSCVCDDSSCFGGGCECVPRFGSIPSAMFFVLLNLSGEFPLAETHSMLGRYVVVLTAILSVGIFAIPTGLIGASLEGAIAALNDGSDKDYDCDEEDVSEIVREARAVLKENEASSAVIPAPPFTLSKSYKSTMGVLILLSAAASVFSTMKVMPWSALVLFFAVDVLCAAFFFFDHMSRIAYAGPKLTVDTMTSSLLPLADLLSWLPTLLYALGGVIACPAYVFITISLFRMVKYERYIQGFQILHKVLDKSYGVLAIGGMAAACCLVFCSALMYYCERNNPDPNMAKYYSSVPTAMWVTLLNLSGESPLCDYTIIGRCIVGMLSVVAVAIFAIPVGALGAGFEEVIGEIIGAESDSNSDDGNEKADVDGSSSGSSGSGSGGYQSVDTSSAFDFGEGIALMNMQPQTGKSDGKLAAAAVGTGYGAIQKQTTGSNGNGSGSGSYAAVPSSTTTTTATTAVLKRKASSVKMEQRPPRAMSSIERIVEGITPRGRWFVTISVFATLFAVALEVISTCDFAQHTPGGQETIAVLEAVVVVWFSIEYLLRVCAHGFSYIFSGLGAVDFASTFPWFLARGVFGLKVAHYVNKFDGPLRALRLLRLVRLDTYAPSISLVAKAFKSCWPGLSVSCYAGVVLWFLFNEALYFSERDDEENGQNKRFRSAVSSLQFSGVLLTGDYPIVDLSPLGKVWCSLAVVIAVGIVAVPASILAGAFVDILKTQAEDRRHERYEAAVKLQRLFRKKREDGQMVVEKKYSSALTNAVKDAVKHSDALRGLNSTHPPFLARICIWKNGHSHSAHLFHQFVAVLITLNIIAVVLESVPEIEEGVPHLIWELFEAVSVLFFTAEYFIDLATAKYDPRHGFRRSKFFFSFMGLCDLFVLLPFYFEKCVLPILPPTFIFDATIFRIFRVAHILEFEQFFTAFSLLDDVFIKAGPVLKATGVLALIVWIGGATIFYYSEPHSALDDTAAAAAQGGEDAAVFKSIPDALYYCAIFLAGEWAVVDFTPVGSVACSFMAIIGVALFSIPVGVLFESFQDMLEEQHSKSKEEEHDEHEGHHH